MKNICVLTVVDTISATSMPVNEFVLYRYKKGYSCRQVLIVCSDKGVEDVVIPESIVTYYVGDSVRKIRACLKRIKQDCTEKGESLVCHLHGQKSALAFFRASIGLGLRKHTLYTVHSTFSSRDFKYKLSSCLCTLLAKKANCVSNSAYEQYQPWVRKHKGANMMAIPNGVDLDRIDQALLGDEDVKPSINSLVCVGRIIPIKNQKFLVSLLPSLPDVTLVLIGAENPSYPVRQYAEELGVAERVEFTGLIPREEVFKKVRQSLIYVSASTVEGLPVSVLEAMAMGLIPILSDIAPHREIEKETDVCSVVPLNEDKWIKAIRLQQGLGVVNVEALSSKIKETVRACYSLEKMHNKYMSIYEELA